MKKIFITLIIILISGIIYMVVTFQSNYSQAINIYNQIVPTKKINVEEKLSNEEKHTFNVYLYDSFSEQFNTIEEAMNYAKQYDKAYITKDKEKQWIWDNIESYIVYSNGTYLEDFLTFQEAYDYAKNFKDAIITYEDEFTEIWLRNYSKKGSAISDVPLLYQYPELPRGCEVTSLTMLMNYNDISVTKMLLAEEIQKEPGIYMDSKTQYYGNPNHGFVGSMTSLKEFGFGVYKDPIYALAVKYATTNALDISGNPFEDIYYFLDHQMPVWVVTNTFYKALDQRYFQEWNTEEGQVIVTNKQHAVVVVGYDEDNIYINDPLNRREKVNKDDFIAAWEQMGSQAITILKTH